MIGLSLHLEMEVNHPYLCKDNKTTHRIDIVIFLPCQKNHNAFLGLRFTIPLYKLSLLACCHPVELAALAKKHIGLIINMLGFKTQGIDIGVSPTRVA